MIWNKTETCVKSVPITTAINYILYENQILFICKIKKNAPWLRQVL